MDFRPETHLTGQVILKTRDVKEFHAYLAEFDGRVDRQVPDTGAFEAELRHTSLGRIDIGLFYCSVPMTVSAKRPSGDDYLVQFPMTGGIELTLDRELHRVVPGRGAVIPPGTQVRRVGQPGWTMVLGLSGKLVRSRLEILLKHSVAGPLIFDVAIGAQATTELRNFIRLVIEAIDRGIARKDSPVASVLETGLVDLLLQLQPHTLGADLAQAEGAERAERVRKVGDYLDLHLSRPVGVRQLAAVAGCSVRALQSTFAELCRVSPLEFVTRHRLQAARRLLESGGPGTTVSQVAVQCGFRHRGRFSEAYRDRFGESPSETLERVGKQDQGETN